MAFKFPNVFGFISKNPILIIAVVFIIIIGVIVLIFYLSVKPEKRVIYFSEAENLATPLDVNTLSATSIFTEESKRFIRFRPAYNLKEGRKNVTLWLGKRGTAYTHKVEDTPKGKAIKIGSLWTAIKGIIGDEDADKIKQNYKEKLMESQVFVTVELESPDFDKYPMVSEDQIKQDADNYMATIFGEGVREGISKKDMIRDIALMGAGMALTFLIQQLGFI